VLCTYVDFIVGVSSENGLVELITEKRYSGVTVTALVFGTGNLNDSMMEAVSNAGNGIYGVISSEAQAEQYVHEKLLSTLIHIAKDVKIQVEFNADHVYAYRLLGYENRALADDDFRDDVVDAGEIGAGHRVTALYELVMAGDSIPMVKKAPPIEDGEAFDGEAEISEEDLILVKVRYKSPRATEDDPATEVQATLKPTDLLGDSSNADDDLRWAVAIAAYAEVLKGSPFADETQMSTIEAIVNEQAGRDSGRTEFKQLFDKASGF
jgi:Ca-activated chloride channel family protein